LAERIDEPELLGLNRGDQTALEDRCNGLLVKAAILSQDLQQLPVGLLHNAVAHLRLLGAGRVAGEGVTPALVASHFHGFETHADLGEGVREVVHRHGESVELKRAERVHPHVVCGGSDHVGLLVRLEKLCGDPLARLSEPRDASTQLRHGAETHLEPLEGKDDMPHGGLIGEPVQLYRGHRDRLCRCQHPVACRGQVRGQLDPHHATGPPHKLLGRPRPRGERKGRARCQFRVTRSPA
jgi:hypothetical protein